MTAYINWMAYTQHTKDGSLPTEGNVVADYDTVASAGTATAPEGAQYASITCSVDTTLEADIISTTGNKDGETIFNAKETFCGAGNTIQIPNIVAGVTTFTVTDV